jgi:hypothetical protein
MSMAAEAYRLVTDDPDDREERGVWRVRNGWFSRRGLIYCHKPESLTAAKRRAAGDTHGKWRRCSADEARGGLSVPDPPTRPVSAVSRPVDRGPVERAPQTLREYLRILYGDVPARSLRYLEWIRTLPCCVCGLSGQSEAHHEPPKGIGGGHSTDYDAVPLCLGDHRIRHGQASGDADAVRAECERARLLLLSTYYAAEDAPVRLARA